MGMACDRKGEIVNDLIEYHTAQVGQMMQAIYAQGVKDGRKQASPTKAKLLEQNDELRREVERLKAMNAELRKAATQNG